MFLGGTTDRNAVRMTSLWLAVVKCILLLFCCMQGEKAVNVLEKCVK